MPGLCTGERLKENVRTQCQVSPVHATGFQPTSSAMKLPGQYINPSPQVTHRVYRVSPSHHSAQGVPLGTGLTLRLNIDVQMSDCRLQAGRGRNKCLTVRTPRPRCCSFCDSSVCTRSHLLAQETRACPNTQHQEASDPTAPEIQAGSTFRLPSLRPALSPLGC